MARREILRSAGVLPRRSFPRPALGFSPTSSDEGDDEERQT